MCFGGKDKEEEDTPAPRRASDEKKKPSSSGGGDASRPRSIELREQNHQQNGSSGRRDNEYAPPSGPPPGHQQEYAPPSGPPPPQGQQDQYHVPPPGPPPGHQQHSQNEYTPPPGPPPPQGNDDNNFAPPPGPPPGHQQEYAPPPGPPPAQSNSEFAPPPGPPPGHQQDSEYAPPPGPPPGEQSREFAPPAGPPPGHHESDFAPPPGPPPGHGSNDFAPPPGPPPGHGGNDYAPPPGPPPPQKSDDWAAPPPGPPPPDSGSQHDWQTAVPDTSLFPPPPAIFSGFDASPASNAPEEEANQGEAWCHQYPLIPPMALDHTALRALDTKNIRVMEPVGFNGKLEWKGLGHWSVTTARNTPDRCLVAYPPLYLVNQHTPLRNGQARTIYYEIKLSPDSRNVTVGMGFTALPYPPFRMPGWHRGSLAVHGDDGHKYINDRWGGKSFTEPMVAGGTYGVGMTIAAPKPDAVGDLAGKPHVEIFFTKNGQWVGSWELHEETDAEQDLPVTGLEGFHDLSAAVGTFDGLEFEVVFDPAKWMYKAL